jgi:hypothetical protein
MRLSPPRLLSLLTLAAVSTVAACKLNADGLGTTGLDVVPDAGAAVSGAADTGVSQGTAGAGALAGSSGSAGASAAAGTSGTAGETAGAGASGVAGQGLGGSAGMPDDPSGAAGNTGMGGAGGDGTYDASAVDGDDGSTTGTPDAGPPAWVVGCADGTREGLQSLARFPDVAACSGGWTVPGLVSPQTLTPQCGRAAGNDGAKPDGEGCSVADLCADGWHVCESAHELAAKAMNCDEAFPGGAVKMFFASRQRAQGTTCDTTNTAGTNNVYGCGNFGSNATCTPFMHMLRDSDCKANPPWMCVDGPLSQSTSELMDVTKPSSEHGGVLCCR